MPTVSDQINTMKTQTALYNNEQNKNNRTAKTSTNDSNMFLTLMLKQLENQDPTQPTDNTQWLSQLAQYSSLEQMTQMNKGLSDCMSFISSMYNDMNMNSEINQTLSMIGKEVTLKIPDEEDKTKYTTVKGTVSEASFEDGTGKVKVGDKYYSIGNIISIRESDGTIKDPIIENHTDTSSTTKKS